MYRQSSSRNHRSKRIKVKHALQICLLLAVSLWLIYQVTHSHDNKKEFEEIDAKDGESSGGFIRIGRKDIPETITENKNHFESAGDEETSEEEEIDEIKHEDEIQEDKKFEDDETDERELEKLDAEVDREEEIVDYEKDFENELAHKAQVLGNEKRENNSDETDNAEIREVGNPSTVTYGELSENSTTAEGLNGNLTKNPDSFLRNATEVLSELDHGIGLEEVNNSTLDVGNNPLPSSSMGHANPSNDTEASMKDEVLKSEMTKSSEEVKADSVVLSGSSNSMEEKNVHVNLDSVPEIQQTEENSPKGVAAQ